MIFTGRVFQLILGAGARTLRVLGAALAGAAVFVARAIRNRREAQVLARLDRNMLADIGLTPADVRDAFAEPLWRDPTGILATRIDERRSNRRRVTSARPTVQVGSSAGADIATPSRPRPAQVYP
jgi:uncharacterized protein YjiS (DUF1127 family)